MKKTLILTITALTLVTLVGCGAKNTTGDSNPNSGAQIESSNESSQTGTSKPGENIQVTPYTGKVEKVVGNELTMKLAKNQGPMPGAPGAEGDSNNPEAGQMIIVDDEMLNQDGGIVQSDEVYFENGAPDMPEGAIGGEIEVGTSAMVAADGTVEESKFSDLEYTDESKDFKIPAGAEIFNMKTGKMGKLSDIKENSILMIMADSKTGTITSISIME